MPPCLVTLLSDGVPDGQRNNNVYNECLVKKDIC